jgi:hypothetical protein
MPEEKDVVQQAVEEVTEEQRVQTVPEDEVKFMDETLCDVITLAFTETWKIHYEELQKMNFAELMQSVFINTSLAILHRSQSKNDEAVVSLNFAGASLIAGVMEFIKHVEEQEQG